MDKRDEAREARRKRMREKLAAWLARRRAERAAWGKEAHKA